tara:strand:- start:2954 stop:4276 length:1323 start_codon:yes stop_codon:yes gene_type:complete
MAFLPKEVEYNRPHASVSPDTTSLNVIVRPSNGQVFQPGGDVITFDLPSRAFMSPASLVLRGIITSTVATAADANSIFGAAPGAAWIQRVETQISGQTVESMNSYGQLYNLLVNTKLGFSERMAMQTELMTGSGATPATSVVVPGAENVSSYLLPTAAGAQTSSFAIPLGCLLSNCTNYVPLGMMGGVRISITTDQLANYAAMVGAGTLSFGSLELAFDMVDFGRGFDAVVGSMADSEGNINLKSSSWNVSSQTLGALTAGTTEEHIYNVRLSSIKSLIIQAGGITDSANGSKYDATAVQGANGSTQFVVASQVYPQTPLAESNQALVMSELRQSLGEAHDLLGSKMSISDGQFNANLTIRAPGGESTLLLPSAHFVGVNTEKVSSNQLLMSGISSQLSPISVRLNYSANVGAGVLLTLFVLYDAILSINLPTRQVQTRV